MEEVDSKMARPKTLRCRRVEKEVSEILQMMFAGTARRLWPWLRRWDG